MMFNIIKDHQHSSTTLTMDHYNKNEKNKNFQQHQLT